MRNYSRLLHNTFYSFLYLNFKKPLKVFLVVDLYLGLRRYLYPTGSYWILYFGLRHYVDPTGSYWILFFGPRHYLYPTGSCFLGPDVTYILLNLTGSCFFGPRYYLYLTGSCFLGPDVTKILLDLVFWAQTLLRSYWILLALVENCRK